MSTFKEQSPPSILHSTDNFSTPVACSLEFVIIRCVQGDVSYSFFTSRGVIPPFCPHPVIHQVEEAEALTNRVMTHTSS